MSPRFRKLLETAGTFFEPQQRSRLQLDHQSQKRHLMNIISTRLSAPPPFAIARPSKWNFFEPRMCTPTVFICMTASRLNRKTNNLGMPLPAGRVRFYRHDRDGQMEFTGEDKIDHTPTDETVRFYTGNAFDIVGERRRTNYRSNAVERWVDESFEIKVRNHKTTPVQVRMVEHLYRWTNWEISQKSDDFKKTDAQTIEFPVQIPPNGEKTVAYMVHYSW